MAMLALLLFSRPVQAEMYVAGQIGAHLPNDASNVEFSASGGTAGLSDLALQNSLMYGAKLGYYFDRVKLGNFNLGIETEVFNATPHVKQQEWTIQGIPLGTAPGLTNRVLTWAPVVVLVRYQAGAFEPYAGVGLGVFFSRLSDGTSSSSGTDVGLNTQVGIRYRVNKNVSLFTEWKYNYANISHGDFLGNGVGVDFSYNYSVHIVAGGLGYHF
jgi:opacity protein-like surface antigen